MLVQIASQRLSVVRRTVIAMTPDLTAEPAPPLSRSNRNLRWSVRFEGTLIGHIGAKKIGRCSTQFYEGFVLVDGHTISIELDPDFENRCEAVLGAWRDPASNVHTRYMLGIKHR